MASMYQVKHTFQLVDSKGNELAYISASSYTQGDIEINKMKENFRDLSPKIIYKKK